jgi:hypothetical protein
MTSDDISDQNDAEQRRRLFSKSKTTMTTTSINSIDELN